MDLTEEQRATRRAIREVAREELRPADREGDRTETFPEDAWDLLAELDLTGLTIPETFGGVGADRVTYAVANEAVAYGSLSIATALSVHCLAASCVDAFGSDEQRERWLPRMAEGRPVGAFALSEPGAGSNPAEMETVARPEGEAYVLDGEKQWITNATRAGVFVVFAKVPPADEADASGTGTGTEHGDDEHGDGEQVDGEQADDARDDGAEDDGEQADGTQGDEQIDGAEGDGERRDGGITQFLVPADAEGLTVGEPESKLGLRASDTAPVTLDGVRIPAEHRLTEVGRGLAAALQVLTGGRVGIAAQAVGLAEAALEDAREYAAEREQFGDPIDQLQSVRHDLAEMATRHRSARLLTYDAARSLERGTEDAPMVASMAKYRASEAAMAVAERAVQLHGGYGYVTEFDVERYYRDAKVTEIYEGTTQIQKEVIARHLLGEA